MADRERALRDSLQMAVEHFEFLAKLCRGTHVYEVERATGKRVRKPLREVISTEAEAGACVLRAALASQDGRE